MSTSYKVPTHNVPSYRIIYHTVHGAMIGTMNGDIEEVVGMCKEQLSTMPELNKIEICKVVTDVSNGLGGSA